MKYSFHREKIEDIVKGSTKHQTVDSIHRELIKLIPNVSKMTVYRNLRQLSSEGEILEFFVDHISHYCGTQSNHYHFACVCCNEVSLWQFWTDILKFNEVLNFSEVS